MANLKDRIIGGFKVLQEIQAGSGSQGTVYKALCIDDRNKLVPVGTVVALKLMTARDEDRSQWAKLVKRTAELVRMDNPNVVKYYGCFSESGLYNDVHVIVQEFLQGETLKERLARCRTGLDVDEAIRIAKAALSGLVYTSGCGIIHRDIKPGNIFLCKDGSVKIIDFEIARQRDGTATSTAGNLRGSFDYMAPDFINAGFHGDLQSDVFSMGVVLHEMLTGKLPYRRIEGDDRMANFAFLSRWANSPSDADSPIHVSSRINRLLVHAGNVMSMALAPQRKNRYGDFQSFRDGLATIGFRHLRNDTDHNTYQLLQFVGKGGFGEVFKARFDQTGQLVAIKHLTATASTDRFHREAKIMKILHDPCFVQFIDFFEIESGSSREAFLVMAFLDGMPGSSLRDAIKRSTERCLSKLDVFMAFERYARGLKTLHSQGIVHRDIKPSNLYFPIGHPERAAIMDLGIVRDVKGTETHGNVPGTLEYMAPEIVTTGNRGDGATDIYALGLCFYEALTAKIAYPRLPTGAAAYTELFKRAKSKIKPNFDDPLVQGDRELLALLNDMTNPEYSHRIRDDSVLLDRIRHLIITQFPEVVLHVNVQPPKPGSEPKDVTDPPPDDDTRDTKVIPKKHWSRGAIAIAVSVIATIAICVAAYLVCEPAKRYFAERGFEDILREYQSGDRYAAEDKEVKWRMQWDPGTHGLFKLDSATYSDYVDKLKSVKSVPQPTVLPLEPVVKPDEIRAKLVAACEELLRIEPIETRRDRLSKALKLVAKAFSEDGVLTEEESRTLKGKIEKQQGLIVGNVSNKCHNVTLNVNGQTIGPGAVRQFKFKNVLPADWSATADGYVKTALRRDFDGRTISIADADLVPDVVSVSLPSLETGVTCHFDGSPVSKSLSLKPGTHSCVYRKNGYKDQIVKFDVPVGRACLLPVQGIWNPLPVKVAMANIAPDVTCRVDDVVVRSDLTLLPGEHVCEYRRTHYKPQKIRFTVVTATPTSLPNVGEWELSDEDKRLVEEAEKKKRLAEEAEREKKKRLAEMARRKKIREDVVAAYEELLLIEPIETRRDRLSKALKLVAKAFSEDGVLTEEESRTLKGKIEKQQCLIVGNVSNKCHNVTLNINGQTIGPGVVRQFKFKNGLPDDWSATADGYVKTALSRDFDGRTISIADADLVPDVVSVSLPSLETGVTCHFDGSPVSKSLSLKPGTHSCVYRKNGYKDQIVKFDVPVGRACLLPVPGIWNPLPVKVAMANIAPDVTCLIDDVVVRSDLTLLPGEHVCEYRRTDYKPQKMRFVIVTATPTSLPNVGEWEPSEGLKRLMEVERYARQKDWSAVERALPDVVVSSEENLRRKRALDNGVKNQNRFKKYVENAVEYYENEFYSDAIRFYCEASKSGYTLTAEDRKRVGYAYAADRKRLKELLEWTNMEIRRGRSVDRNPESIEAEIKTLLERYRSLK